MFKDNPYMNERANEPPSTHQSQIPYSLGSQSELIVEIENYLSQLEAKITPIMLQPEVSKVENESTPSAKLVELAMIISTNNIKLSKIIEYIKSMISRCEL